MDHVEYYKKQISLTEWLEKMGHKNATSIRLEDNEKRERLKVLQAQIGLPYDEPHQFTASQIVDNGQKFQEFVEAHGDELCALRLIPTDPSLPKLRMRGQSIRKALEWFKTQNIDPAKYRADFVPHPPDESWATIFVVNEHGIFGETIKGGHNKLTQGLYDDSDKIYEFSSDFKTWHVSPANAEAEAYLRQMTDLLRVPDQHVKAALKKSLNATFAGDYLCGYFETTSSVVLGTWFIDYNRILGDMYQSFAEKTGAHEAGLVHGMVGSPGYAKGSVKIIEPGDSPDSFHNGEILVCRMTTPDYLPFMMKAAAIVTDLGGVLSHAAIVARELGKPCVTATKDATKKLANGQVVEVDADSGIVRLSA
jgi:phosphohistidine swiveling domain-containing protein